MAVGTLHAQEREHIREKHRVVHRHTQLDVAWVSRAVHVYLATSPAVRSLLVGRTHARIVQTASKSIAKRVISHRRCDFAIAHVLYFIVRVEAKGRLGNFRPDNVVVIVTRHCWSNGENQQKTTIIPNIKEAVIER